MYSAKISPAANEGVSAKGPECRKQILASIALALCAVNPFPSYAEYAEHGRPSQEGNSKSSILFGRIEELVNKSGAAIPHRLQSLVPMLDTSIAEKPDKPLSGHLVQSFPPDWEGMWKGNVVVKQRECLELAWLSQPAATYRSCQFFKPGQTLSLICRFSMEGNQLILSPPVLRARLKHAEDLVQAVLADAGEEISGTNMRIGLSDLGMKTVPVFHTETFSLGKRYGPSAGGNFVESEVLSNTVRELQTGIIEQDIYSSGSVRSLYAAGDPFSSLSESVVRLSKLKDGKMLVNLAYVNYLPDGNCINKFVLEGSLEREGN